MVLGHWVERRAFGLSPWGYHLDSLLLYGLVCALAASVALLVTRRRDMALFAGCFFAVAPIHAEVVAAVNYREDLFAGLGTLGVLACLGTPARAAGDARTGPGAVRTVARALGVGVLLAVALGQGERARARAAARQPVWGCRGCKRP